MNIIFFYKQAIRSFRKGYFYWRPWKQLLRIIVLEIECVLLTGKTLNEL
jgi:hypothetical protein